MPVAVTRPRRATAALGPDTAACPSPAVPLLSGHPKGGGGQTDRRPVFWKIFAGEGHLTTAAARMGFRTLPPIDLKSGAHHDSARPAVLSQILTIIRSGQVDWIHLGTPCTTFCRFFVMFAKECSRTMADPAGSGQSAREVLGNLLLDISCRIVRLAMKVGTWWTLENPRSSLLWLMP